MSRTCTACHTEKPSTEFRAGRTMRCKLCASAQERAKRERGGSKPRAFLHYGENEKQCGRCRAVKVLADFYPSGRRGSWCRECMRSYYKAKHDANPHLHAEIQRNQRRNKQNLLREHKRECAECGENHPAVLDFHHTDPSVKEYNLSWAAANNRAVVKLKAEIAKCVVLCANCHRKLHWNEKHSAQPALTAVSA